MLLNGSRANLVNDVIDDVLKLHQNPQVSSVLSKEIATMTSERNLPGQTVWQRRSHP